MKRGLPPFSSLWTHYPRGDSSDVKRMIGGNVNLPWLKNTCVVRTSRAFNYSSQPIPQSFGGLSTIKGGDGKRYAYRVSEFQKYMEAIYGPPTHSGKSSGDLADVKGLILFDVDQWSDATGHFDIWDGSDCKQKSYFAESTHVYVWEAP